MNDLENLPSTTFTPRELVSELDRYIIGQQEAKRAVAIALRNRWRRQRVPPELRDEIAPKNIIMIGPTGVGKTEIARRLARLSRAPFLKVEASKYTEVGYVGRDVESMVRDLAEVAVKLVRDEEAARVRVRAAEAAEERLLDLLSPRASEPRPPPAFDFTLGRVETAAPPPPPERTSEEREKLRRMLRDGLLDEREVEVTLSDRGGPFPFMQVFSTSGVEEMNMNLQDALGNLFPKRSKKKHVKVPEALNLLTAEETQRLVDNDRIAREALVRAEHTGIIFIDELDKVAGRESGRGPDVSREGVQRDLLPVVEGCAVATKYGMLNTQHILFIAAGAFNVAKPSDLIPELQGRFPIRVELKPLGRDDFTRILTEPQNSLIKQYTALLATEKVELSFSEEAVQRIAEVAAEVNARAENIGARRLHTVMEKLLEDLSFKAPEIGGAKVRFGVAEVNAALSGILQDMDLSRYIL